MEFVRRLTIKVARIKSPVSSLSGGNQQKVVIGKVLMTGPKVLLMDEPSRGIDIGAKAEVFRTMRRLFADGLGMTFVIITGGIDLSVGSIVGLCAMVSGWLVLCGINPGLGWSIQFTTLEIALLVVLVTVAVGLINGHLITRLNVAPFIATLGTLYVARGAALLSQDGRTFPNHGGNPEYGSASFPWIGSGTLLGLPVMIWMLIGVGLIASYISRRTPLGRHIYAVGGNERGAALSGVKVTRVKMLVYMFYGFCAALVALSSRASFRRAIPPRARRSN